jgi:threonine dehydratase
VSGSSPTGDAPSLDSVVREILRAQVYEVAVETPIDYMPRLSRRLDNHVNLKREDLQPVFSFKLRGAFNKLNRMSAPERRRGVVAASAGNHAQGVALAASILGIKATIVMPTTTPSIKVEAVSQRGATVVLHGDAFDDARLHAEVLCATTQAVMIPPYDDADIIAGQGTVGMEILRQHTGRLDAVFVPVGGGGLIAGIAAYIKYVRPEVQVIGVEAEDSACLAAAMAAGRPVDLERVGLFADGVAVRRIGTAPFQICKDHVDSVVTVTTDEICSAIKDVFDDTRSIAEPAGALAVAGVTRWVAETGTRGASVVAIHSGANVNFGRLRHIAERVAAGDAREAILAVTIPESPGSFRRFCELLGPRNVTEFNYRYGDDNSAQVYVGVGLAGAPDARAALVTALEADGYGVVDLSDNEMAKVHIRHMVGGKSVAVADERVSHFIFPERPGALMRFLTELGARWNISMFHYRNHGAGYGRVLVGMQVPKQERAAWLAAAKTLGYPFSDETDNPAYRLFLA